MNDTSRQVLLFSGGLDSYPAWHYLGRPPTVYFNLGHRYLGPELAAITELAERCGIPVEISDELNLAQWEAPDAIIPMRNVYLAMLAANRAETAWCVGVRGDHVADKSPEAFAEISAFISRYTGSPFTLDSPFWSMTKTEIVAWYLAEGLPAEDLLLTYSCSRDDESRVHCGRCSSCLRRWISLVNNDVTADFELDPWTWERVGSYYVPAMRDGTYPDHRANEFFAALQKVGVRPNDAERTDR